MAVTWITEDDVREALGRPDLVGDPYLASCTAAANEWARMRRAKFARYAGDVDLSAPNAAVKLGTVLFAVALMQTQGSTEEVASFADFAAGATSAFGTFGEIKRLLGINLPVAS